MKPNIFIKITEQCNEGHFCQERLGGMAYVIVRIIFRINLVYIGIYLNWLNKKSSLIVFFCYSHVEKYLQV